MNSERQRIFDMFGGKCAYCGCELVKGWHVDHVKPINRKMIFKDHRLIQSGECCNPENDVPENKFPSCARCNNWKHSNDLETFRRDVATQVEKARRYSRNFKMAEKYGLVREIKKPIVFYFESLTPKEKL